MVKQEQVSIRYKPKTFYTSARGHIHLERGQKEWTKLDDRANGVGGVMLLLVYHFLCVKHRTKALTHKILCIYHMSSRRWAQWFITIFLGWNCSLRERPGQGNWWLESGWNLKPKLSEFTFRALTPTSTSYHDAGGEWHKGDTEQGMRAFCSACV